MPVSTTEKVRRRAARGEDTTAPSKIQRDESELKDPAWERQSWETPVAYNRFRLYRDMPNRNVGAVAQHFAVGENNVRKIATRNLWVERCARYDAHLDTLGLAVTAKAVQHEAARTAMRVNELTEAEWAIWEDAKETVVELLKAARNGDSRAAGQAASLIRETNRIARLSTGLPTEGRRPKDGEDAGRESDLDAFLNSLVGDDTTKPA